MKLDGHPTGEVNLDRRNKLRAKKVLVKVLCFSTVFLHGSQPEYFAVVRIPHQGSFKTSLFLLQKKPIKQMGSNSWPKGT